ncbi:MAG: ethylbenzene dehydrogenase-related protein [Candidatus Thorarchaeota archaeon]
MMKANEIRKAGLALTIAFVITIVLAHPVAADVNLTAPKYSGIVVDGLADDWAGVDGIDLTLIRPMASSERLEDGLTLKVAYDDANIYVLAMIHDDYDFNETDPHDSGSLAVLFQIDDAARVDMGGGLGNVDIWHWELETPPGVPAGGPDFESGNDPEGNFDDEWAFDVEDRHDDTMANELYGVWSHTGNLSLRGSDGTWIFEMRRSLTTSDTMDEDAQFSAGGTFGMAIAYWDADQTATGWEHDGHYASCRDPATLDFSWIQVSLAAAGGGDGALLPAYSGLGLGGIALVIALVSLLRPRKAAE